MSFGTRGIPLIICETVNELVRNNVDGAQNRADV